MTHEVHDVVIVGGGIAGLSAATRAAEGGLGVVVLEQGDEQRYACNSRSAGGILHVAYTDPAAPPTDLASAVRKAMGGEADEMLIEAVSRRARPALAWLQSHGARFVKASPTPWHRWTLAPPRPMQAGLDFPGCGPDRLLSSLTADFKSSGGTLKLGHRVRAVERAAEGFLVTVDTAEGVHNLLTHKLVLADGGFQGDTELVRRFIGPRPERIVQRGTGTGRGTAVRVGESLGCSFSRMDRFYGHLLSRDALLNNRLWPYPLLDTLLLSSVVVDCEGRRIVDEGRGGVYLANFLAKLDDPAGCFLVFDGAIWDSAGRESLLPANPHLETLGATIYRAESLPDLAIRAEIDVQGLDATMDAYNAAARGGLDRLATLQVPRSGAARPICSGGFFAVPMAPGITNTMGGIRVDGDARALNALGVPIPGLYAVGASAGGLEGGANVGYVGGLMRGVTSGLAAGEHMLAATGRSLVMPGVDSQGSATTGFDTNVLPKVNNRGPSIRTLRLLTSHAKAFAIATGLFAAITAGCVGASASSLLAVPMGLAGGVGGYLLASAFTELAAIILVMLVPE